MRQQIYGQPHCNQRHWLTSALVKEWALVFLKVRIKGLRTLISDVKPYRRNATRMPLPGPFQSLLCGKGVVPAGGSQFVTKHVNYALALFKISVLWLILMKIGHQNQQDSGCLGWSKNSVAWLIKWSSSSSSTIKQKSFSCSFTHLASQPSFHPLIYSFLFLHLPNNLWKLMTIFFFKKLGNST